MGNKNVFLHPRIIFHKELQNIGERKIFIHKGQFTAMCGVIIWNIAIALEIEYF